MDMCKITDHYHARRFEISLGEYITNKPIDCILYSENGEQFKIHKEFLCQTSFLRKMISSAKEQCCNTIEILCPCTTKELGHLVGFLSSGEIYCEDQNDSIRIQENLVKICGFPKDLYLTNPDQDQNGNQIDETLIKQEINLEDPLETFDSQDTAINYVASESFSNEEQNSEFSIYPNYRPHHWMSQINQQSMDEVAIKKESNTEQFEYTEEITEKNSVQSNLVKIPILKKNSRQVKNKKIFDKTDINKQKKQNTQKTKNANKKICNYCGHHFAGNQTLRQHINDVHLKLKPYKCEKCKKCFSQGHNLKFHMNSVHLKVKPYKCHLCSYSCGNRSNLTKHIDTVHLNVKRHLCEICNMGFYSKVDFRRHVNGKSHIEMENLKRPKSTEYVTSVDESNKKNHVNNPIIADSKILEPKNEDIDINSNESSKYKTRKSYTYSEKAEIINGFFSSNDQNEKLSISLYAKKVGLSKTIVFRWLQDKEDILKKASDERICSLKKNRDLKAANKKSNLKNNFTGNLIKHVDTVHLNMKRHFCEICNKAYYSKVDFRAHVNEKHLNIPKRTKSAE